MSSMKAVSKQTRRLAGIAAIVGTFFTMGGTLTLAQHYAHTGKNGRDYAVANAAADGAAPATRRYADNARVAHS